MKVIVSVDFILFYVVYYHYHRVMLLTINAVRISFVS